ncbi:MAG: hypothetical protein ABIT37_03820 [Luteolibacter sp.]
MPPSVKVLFGLKTPPAGYLEYQPFRCSAMTRFDPISRELHRRLDAAIDRRRAAALSEGSAEDEALWIIERRRVDKLTLAIVAYDSRPF